MKREITCLYGIGLNDWFVQDIQKKKRLTASIIHETIIQIGEQNFLTVVLLRTIYSSVLGNYILKRKCFLQKNSSDILYLRIV